MNVQIEVEIKARKWVPCRRLAYNIQSALREFDQRIAHGSQGDEISRVTCSDNISRPPFTNSSTNAFVVTSTSAKLWYDEADHLSEGWGNPSEVVI